MCLSMLVLARALVQPMRAPTPAALRCGNCAAGPVVHMLSGNRQSKAFGKQEAVESRWLQFVGKVVPTRSAPVADDALSLDAVVNPMSREAKGRTEEDEQEGVLVASERESAAKLWAEAKVGAATEAVQKAVDETQAAARRVAALPGDTLEATRKAANDAQAEAQRALEAAQQAAADRQAEAQRSVDAAQQAVKDAQTEAQRTVDAAQQAVIDASAEAERLAALPAQTLDTIQAAISLPKEIANVEEELDVLAQQRRRIDAQVAALEARRAMLQQQENEASASQPLASSLGKAFTGFVKLSKR